MAADPRLLAILSELLAKTKADQVSWEPTVASNEFLTAFPEHSVKVQYQGGSYYLIVNDKAGRRLVSLTGQTAGAEQLLPELYDLARRKALKIDENLDSLLSQLRLGKLGE